jgi:pyruvate/oxaloacetate carboxyltransferase
MKSNILTILLILISILSYSQYPATKIIGKDSVVIITIKQGEEMNKKFLSMKDTIRNLKASYDTLNGAFIDYQIRSMYDLQKMYNKATYESNRRKVDSANYESIIKDLSNIVPPEPKKSGVKVTAIIFSIYIVIVSLLSR